MLKAFKSVTRAPFLQINRAFINHRTHRNKVELLFLLSLQMECADFSLLRYYLIFKIVKWQPCPWWTYKTIHIVTLSLKKMGVNMQTLIYNVLHRPTLGEFRVVPRSRVVTGVSLYGVSVKSTGSRLPESKCICCIPCQKNAFS